MHNTSVDSTHSIDVRKDIDRVAWQKFNRIHALTESFIWKEIQTRLHQHLDILTVLPKQILNAHSRAGSGAVDLAKRYPNVPILAQCTTLAAVKHLQQLYPFNYLQPIHSWLNKLGLSRFNQDNQYVSSITWADTVPPNTVYDLIVSNLDLTYLPNPVEQLKNWANLLAPGGVLLFSALGPDTGASIGLAAQQSGWTTPIAANFVDMHDYGDMMVYAGLSTPVINVDRLKLSYTDINLLRQDCLGLRANLHPQRLMGLPGKTRFKRLINHLNSNKPLLIEFELIFGHAFKPIASSNPIDKTNSYISLDQLKATLPSKQ